jgi:hypothetical protein
MNRGIMILSLAIMAGYVTPDLSQAHSHILALPQSEIQPVVPAEPVEFIGPVLRSRGLSQRVEQPSWDGLSLTHPNTPHFQGSEQQHPAAYRSSNAPDGVALIFSWPFTSVPIFLMSPQNSSSEPTLSQDYLR